MVTGIIAGASALLKILAPFLGPFMAFLAGWLFPSPMQKGADSQAKVHDAEKDATRNTDNLDRIP